MHQELNNLALHNIFIPSKVPSKKVMVVLHGRGDSAEGFTMLPQFLELDDMNYLLLDAPFEYYGGYSWYALPPKQLPGIEYSSKVLEEIFDTIFEEQFDAQQSFLFGFSQGSLLTFEFGARYKKALAGYIAVSGYIYDEKKVAQEYNPSLNQNNWLAIHGTKDSVLAFESSKKQVEYLQEEGFQITFKSFEKDHEVIKEELKFIREWMLQQLSKDVTILP